MNIDYQDYLIEKPLCLIYWNLDFPYSIIKNYFSESFEIRDIENLEELIYWYKIDLVRIVILGAKGLEEIKEFIEFLNERIPIEKRREMFLIYILPKAKTLSSKETFLLNANLIVSEEHLSDFGKIYQKASLYWDVLYIDFKKAYERLKEEF